MAAFANSHLDTFQVTRGGGALTLASQWKSQFDDSEETTDNEWKQEPQVCFFRFDFTILKHRTFETRHTQRNILLTGCFSFYSTES